MCLFLSVLSEYRTAELLYTVELIAESITVKGAVHETHNKIQSVMGLPPHGSHQSLTDIQSQEQLHTALVSGVMSKHGDG